MTGSSAGAEGRVVACAQQVERRPHERRAHDLAAVQRGVEILAPERFEPRPEADERGPRLLRLEAGEARDRLAGPIGCRASSS